jgi:ferritin-like metal-binding protein YciE
MERGIKGLLIDELHDLFSAEHQILEALPELISAAESPDLRKALEHHLHETEHQVQRLEKAFKLLKTERQEKFCHAMEGLIQECREVLREFKTKSSLRDAAIISKAQRIEHYEISAYGTVCTFAKEIDNDSVAELLHATLDEEEAADKKLTKIAEGGLLKSGVNYLANSHK